MYGGSLTYGYNKNGNLTHKGKATNTLKYGSNCATPGSTYAVCEDWKGNAYTYDQNGNMTTRKGRTLHYDSEDRLVAIKAAGGLQKRVTCMTTREPGL